MWRSLFFLWVLAAFAKGSVDAIISDIEGTTTSISFVRDTLFPYAKEQVKDYLLINQNEPSVSQLIQEIARAGSVSHTDLSQVAQVLLKWMEQDQKITSLKTLQGMMWKTGYEEGHFQGHVYRDAFEELQYWHEQGLALYIYSSGSVPAQKLLFSHSTFGDLTPLFSGYFDTQIGGKKESNSYRRIAAQIQIPPERILFLSDVVEELNAAAEAGMQTLLILREGTIFPIGCSHDSAQNFHQVFNQ